MAAGDPVKVGSLATTPVFLMSAETGIIIEQWDRSIDSQQLDQYDAAVGYDTGSIFHNFKAEYTVKGKTNGSTGVMAASVGVAITFANSNTAHGVASGGIYTKSVALSHQGGQLRDITVQALQRHGIA